MAFACQVDSYRRSLRTVVRSCDPVEMKHGGNKINGYDIILKDTVLFPEGGGQSDDRGTIAGHPVLRVTRKGADAVHFIPVPLDIGAEVELEVDWVRRFDHMQQHSGQHLISALGEQIFNYDTTSWWLGEKISYVELDTAKLTNEEMIKWESLCNEKIREALPMYPKVYSGVDDPELSYSTKSLPADHVGPIRVMIIEGVDENMCCGTHVSNLSHLQAIKLLGFEKGKKGKTKLNFVVGDRVLQYLQSCYENEKSFLGLLKCPPNEHVEMVQKILKNVRELNKNQTTILRDLAALEAEKIKASGDKLVLMHRKEGDSEFMNTIHNKIDSKDVLKFLTVGDEKGVGFFLLSGRDDEVALLGPKIAEILDGKGAGKQGRFQGKVNKLSNRTQMAAEAEPRMAAEAEPRMAAEAEPRMAAEAEPQAAAEAEPLCHPSVSSACQSGCAACLRTLVGRGEAVDGRDNLGWRPVHVVSASNHVDSLKILLDHGQTDVNWPSFEEQTPLMIAVKEGHLEVTKLLLEAGAAPNARDSFSQPPLSYAIKNNRPEFVRHLCQLGADPNAIDDSDNFILNSAADNDEDEIDVEIIRILLESGADLTNVTPYGFNALMSALNSTNITAFNLLLEYARTKLETTEVLQLVNQKSENTGRIITPLTLAARLESPEPLDKLLQCGADPNAANCAAIFSSLHGSIECLKRLLPPVTELAELEIARYESEHTQPGSILLESTLNRNDEWLNRDSEGRCERLRLLLESGLDSIINVRTRVEYLPPFNMCWTGLAGAPRSFKATFGHFMTPLTQMIIARADRSVIELMLKHDATWKGKFDRLAVGTVPAHFYLRTEWVVELFAQHFGLDIYNPLYTFNLALLPNFFFPNLVDQFLRCGAECESVFVPRTHDVSKDAWTFEKLLHWLKINKNEMPGRRDSSVSFYDNRLSRFLDDARFFESFEVLLKYTCCPGVLSWVLELIDDSDIRAQMHELMSRPSSLKHICRVHIRKEMKGILGDAMRLKATLVGFGLPDIIVQYLMFSSF